MIVINNNLLPTIQNRERATAQDLLIRTVWCLQQKKGKTTTYVPEVIADEINESVEYFTKRLDR